MRGAPDGLLKNYGNCLLEVDSPNLEKILSGVPGVLGINIFGARCHVETREDGASESAVRRALDAAGLSSVSVRRIRPSLEDLFVSRLPSIQRGREGKE
jgi:hypothetical protein